MRALFAGASNLCSSWIVRLDRLLPNCFPFQLWYGELGRKHGREVSFLLLCGKTTGYRRGWWARIFFSFEVGPLVKITNPSIDFQENPTTDKFVLLNVVCRNEKCSKSHMFYLSKNKWHWYQRIKVVLSVGNVRRVQQCIHLLFSSCLMQWWKRFTRGDIVDWKNREVCP